MRWQEKTLSVVGLLWVGESPVGTDPRVSGLCQGTGGSSTVYDMRDVWGL
jgi:hypothetical protein